MIKKIFIMCLIFQCFIFNCIGHTLNINIHCKTFEIKTLYNKETPIINQQYCLYYLNNSNMYEKYVFGKTNIYGNLFFDSYLNINQYKLEILSGEHSIHQKFELLAHQHENNNNHFASLKNILFGINWIVGISGILFYLLSKNNFHKTK